MEKNERLSGGRQKRKNWFTRAAVMAGLCVAVLSLAVTPAKAFDSGDYEYDDLGDGTVRITGYKGTEESVTIPEKLDGLPVVEIGGERLYTDENRYIVKTITLPASLKKIGKNAFEEWKSLETVNFAEGVTEIGYAAFSGCDKLKNVKLPNSLKSIGDYAFSGCTALENSVFVLPDGLKTIGDGVFHNTKYLLLNIPSSVISIGTNAFPADTNGIHYTGTSAQWNSLYPSSNTGANKVHYVTKTSAVAQTCTEQGHKEYYTCSGTYVNCKEAKFKDEKCSEKFASGEEVIPANHDESTSFKFIKGTYPTFDAEGNLPYYECNFCGKKFTSNTAEKEEIPAGSEVLPKVVPINSITLFGFTDPVVGAAPSSSVSARTGEIDLDCSIYWEEDGVKKTVLQFLPGRTYTAVIKVSPKDIFVASFPDEPLTKSQIFGLSSANVTYCEFKDSGYQEIHYEAVMPGEPQTDTPVTKVEILGLEAPFYVGDQVRQEITVKTTPADALYSYTLRWLYGYEPMEDIEGVTYGAGGVYRPEVTVTLKNGYRFTSDTELEGLKKDTGTPSESEWTIRGEAVTVLEKVSKLVRIYEKPEDLPGVFTDKIVLCGTKAEKPADPERNGWYEFGGWYRCKVTDMIVEYLDCWDFDKDIVEDDTLIIGKWDRKMIRVAVTGHEEGNRIGDAKVRILNQDGLNVQNVTWAIGSIVKEENDTFEFNSYTLTFTISGSVPGMDLGKLTKDNIMINGVDLKNDEVAKAKYDDGVVAVTFNINSLDSSSCLHTVKEEISKVEATCTEDGCKAYYICNLCGKMFADDGMTEEVTDLTSLKIPAGHKIVTDEAVPATCTKKGLTEGSHCSLCGVVLTVQEETEMVPHTPVAVPGTDADCTTNGKTAGEKCSVCNKILKKQELIPAGHTPGPAATESTPQICTVCHVVLNPALGHTHKTTKVEGKAATCTEAGAKEYYTCTCGMNFEDAAAAKPITVSIDTWKAISAAGHTPGPAATESAPQTCTVCHAVLNPALSHTHKTTKVEGKAATCTEAGAKEYYTCTCGMTFEDAAAAKPITASIDTWKVIPATGHIPGPAATESTPQTCTVCHAVLNPALGHTHKTTKVNGKAATCTEAGAKEYYTCTCGMYFEDAAATKPVTDAIDTWKVLPALGHTPVGIPAVAATTKKDGLTAGEKCSVCGEVITAQQTVYKASDIKLSQTVYVYDGKTKNPKLTVKDSKGNTIASSNYTVTKAKGRKTVGKYTYKITFKGNYSGTKKVSFTINPKTSSVTKVTAGSKSLKVVWKKMTKEVTGYEIEVATDRKFKKNVQKATVKKAATTNTTLKKLKGNTKYYIRVRTYKTVGKTKYYSEWKTYSKTVKTKK